MSILTVIIQSTIVNSIFYLIAIGWGTTLQNIDKNIVTNLLIVGGSLYLLQLAKSYSESDSTSYPVVFNVFLIAEYCILLIYNRIKTK